MMMMILSLIFFDVDDDDSEGGDEEEEEEEEGRKRSVLRDAFVSFFLSLLFVRPPLPRFEQLQTFAIQIFLSRFQKRKERKKKRRTKIPNHRESNL